jgi:hypothetical protein
MSFHVGPLRTDVSGERIPSITRVIRIGDQGTTIEVTTETRCEEIQCTYCVVYYDDVDDTSLESSVSTRSTRLHIPEDDILHSHYREHLKSYTARALYRRRNVSPVR